MPTASSEHMREIGRAGARAKKVAAIERRIKDLVDSAPPLDEATREKLAVLLRGAPA